MSSPVDPLPSPSSSPSISPTRARRLSARRGSVSASDPWGVHSPINNNPNRATSSRLTIVRVPPSTEDEANQRKHRRHGSNASLSSNSSAGKADGSRMSFAFSSFGQQPSNGSPNTSPRIRPQSPTLGRRYSGSMSKLPPEQLLDVARQSCNPRPANCGNGNSPVTPSGPAPASFTPLPDSILLPFIDRPGEVQQLMTTPPSAKLFALLAQTFPAEARTSTGTESAESLLGRDPRQWTYAELAYWMQAVDRDTADDVLWVSKARTCIMAKSELIWERIKGALGVPPELDVDEEEIPSVVEPEGLPESAVLTSESDSERYSNVFESPSPLLAVNPPSPNLSPDDLTIEPVLAGHNLPRPPTSSILDPSATHELTEVREEDENENENDGTQGEGTDSRDGMNEAEVHGIRIATSPALTPTGPNYVLSPSASPSPLPLGSPMGIPRSSRAPSMSDRDVPYDALNERGPGHPLFPSNFAHLSMAPTLRSNSLRSARAQSLWNPLAPAFGSPHEIRTGLRATTSTGGFRRPDWAHAYDPARHEYAVASSAGSVSGVE